MYVCMYICSINRWRMGSRIFIFFCDYKLIKSAFSKIEFADRPDFYSFDIFNEYTKSGGFDVVCSFVALHCYSISIQQCYMLLYFCKIFFLCLWYWLRNCLTKLLCVSYTSLLPYIVTLIVFTWTRYSCYNQLKMLKIHQHSLTKVSPTPTGKCGSTTEGSRCASWRTWVWARPGWRKLSGTRPSVW